MFGMKVKELAKELKKLPADAEVFMVADWSETDEYGCLTELRELNGVTSQVHVEDMGLDFEDVTEVLLDFG